jgi:WD40 repeat protein
MSIKLDWQIVQESTPPPGDAAPEPRRKPRRRLPLKWLAAIGAILVVALASAVAYMNSVYRRQLAQVEREILPLARQEAQAIAKDDLDSFLALQDPDDPAWRAVQKEHFGRFERNGLPEFGWEVMGNAPHLGSVTLEPGGARLDVFYQYAVTDPMPGGPVSITLQLPQFYRQTSSGWAHGNLSAEFWGPWRSHGGKFFSMQYARRDADVLEPLIPRMDEMLAKMCNTLACPKQPIFVIFESSPDALARLTDFSYGFDESSFILRLPSPHLTGVPTDARSRDELYRAIGTHVIQALVYETSGRRLYIKYSSSQSIVRWALVYAGLAGPPTKDELTRLLALTSQVSWPSLMDIPLRQPGETLLPLAFSFIDEVYGPGYAVRLIPAIGASQTLGEAISMTLRVNPATLEAGWQKYWRRQANLPTVTTPPPTGELWLSCVSDNMNQSAIWRINTDGSEATQIISNTRGPAWLFAWSHDGKRLAYLDGMSTTVIDAERQMTQVIPYNGLPHWLPDGRLWIDDFFSDFEPGGSHLLNLDTGETVKIGGWRHTWSPDGKHVAYYETTPTTTTLWIANADGSQPRAIAPGYGGAWSPDSKRLAFWGGVTIRREQARSAMEIQTIDIESGQVTTFARRDEIQRSLGEAQNEWSPNELLWSPDGSVIVASFWREGPSPTTVILVLLDAQNGAIRTEWRGSNIALPLNLLGQRVWLDGGRYLILVAQSESSTTQLLGDMIILDTQTGKQMLGPRTGLWDRSPDGKWLAVPQGDQGVLLVTADLAAIHRLTDVMGCYSVAWRP